MGNVRSQQVSHADKANVNQSNAAGVPELKAAIKRLEKLIHSLNDKLKKV